MVIMKKLIIVLAALCVASLAYARDYSIKVSADIPSAAADVLVQRFTQMLKAGGHSVSADGTPLELTGVVKERMETPGSMSQTALTIELKAVTGGVQAVFPLTGVGEDEADAWLRAVKRFLPHSKEAQKFVSELK